MIVDNTQTICYELYQELVEDMSKLLLFVYFSFIDKILITLNLVTLNILVNSKTVYLNAKEQCRRQNRLCN